MSKTIELRRLITEELNKVPGETYHRRAPDDAIYPYKVYDLSRVDIGDPARDDIDLCVDLFDHSDDYKAIEEIADEIEGIFNCLNLPQQRILPTFFKNSRYPVEETDKDIQHLQLHFDIQMYERR